MKKIKGQNHPNKNMGHGPTKTIRFPYINDRPVLCVDNSICDKLIVNIVSQNAS